MAELTAIISAEEPNELGVELGFPIGPLSVCSLTLCFSLIVVHGVKTCGLQPLNDGWHKSIFKTTPANTRLLEHNVNLNVSEKFQWKDIQDRSTGLLRAICMEYKDIRVWHPARFIKYTMLRLCPQTVERPIAFFCYGFAGTILKQAGINNHLTSFNANEQNRRL